MNRSLYEELKSLCLINAQKAVRTEQNEIPAAEDVEVAKQLLMIAMTIDEHLSEFSLKTEISSDSSVCIGSTLPNCYSQRCKSCGSHHSLPPY